MKKNQKRIAINNQEDEDFEVYILYPENAIADITQERLQHKRNAGSKTVLQSKVSSGTTIKNLQRLK